jgi:hypothetical protein
MSNFTRQQAEICTGVKLVDRSILRCSPEARDSVLMHGLQEASLPHIVRLETALCFHCVL